MLLSRLSRCTRYNKLQRTACNIRHVTIPSRKQAVPEQVSTMALEDKLLSQSTIVDQSNVIENAVKLIIDSTNNIKKKSILSSDEELRRRLEELRKFSAEARRCIEDCKVMDSDDITQHREEVLTAQAAVNLYSEVLAELLGDLIRKEKLLEKENGNNSSEEKLSDLVRASNETKELQNELKGVIENVK